MKTCVLMFSLLAVASAQEPATRPQVPGAQSPGIKITSPTRPVVMFSRMERELLADTQQKKTDAIKAFLTPDFEMLQPTPPGDPIPADQWLAQLSKSPTIAAFRTSQMSVHSVSNDAAIVSFVQSLKLDERSPKFEDTFIVDYWINDSGTWKLKVRYCSTVQDFPHPAAPKPTGKE